MTIHNLHLKPQVFTRKAFNSVSFFKQETRKSFFNRKASNENKQFRQTKTFLII